MTKSTSAWPSAEHIKIGFFYVQSATAVQANGAMINQNWNDFASDDNDQGHVTDIGAWIRAKGANWFSGCDGGGTSGYLTPYAGGASIQVNAGVISQLRKQAYPSHDTSGTDIALVYNYPADAWRVIDDINDILVDSAGVSLTGKFFNIVIGGIANKGGEYSPLIIKLPAGSYNTEASAVNDTENYTDYSMPREFNKESSTGFLIARVTIRNQADTTFTVSNTQDLRGQDGATAVGSTGGTVLTDFADNQFSIYNNTDATKVIAILASSITTGNTRTITMADVDVDLADIAVNTAKVSVPSGTDGQVMQYSGTTPTATSTLTGLASISLAAATDYKVGATALSATAETLTNKTMDNDVNTFNDMPVEFCVAASDETTDLAVGTAKVTFRAPWAFTLTAVRTSVNTAPVGSTLNVDINEAGTTVLSTVITIDASEKTSTTAATPPVISDSAIAADAEMTIDIDQIGSSTAGKGAKVCLYGKRNF